MKLVLASASPRRKELIKIISDDVIIHPAKGTEILPETVEADNAAEFLACQKALEVSKEYPDIPVIGADTVVIINGEILGKPKDRQDAFKMLSLLSGETHKVITGCAIFYGKKSLSFSVTSLVTFYPLSEKEINDYIDTNEPMDKAGAYGIQKKGALLVKEINGDYFNIVGLPVSELNKKIKMLIK